MTATYSSSETQRLQFWENQARQLTWQKSFQRVYNEDKLPFVTWFEDGIINISENCLDRHLNQGLTNKTALIWEGEPGEQQTYTYQQLFDKVCQLACALDQLGVQKGDRVVIYLPLIPEAIISMLACARIGAIHSVIFAGFAKEAIRDRILDCEASCVITADGGYRRGQIIALKDNIDAALTKCPSVKNVIVVQRTKKAVSFKSPRDLWWNDVVDSQPTHRPATGVNSEHPLFILYTSGTTGKPKGIVHSTGGYAVQTAISHRQVFDLKEDDIYWCSADIGWITGHSYVTYGPLLNASTVFIYEGAPDTPDKSRFWQMIERYHITIFYTAPTAIRTFMRWGDQHIRPFDLTRLRILGSVGEPINPAAWHWYKKTIGQNRCPIVDTWWQTETGAIMMTPLTDEAKPKPGACQKALPGICVDVIDKNGQSCAINEAGFLVITASWPAQLRTIWRDNQRYLSTYFKETQQYRRFLYFTGDGAKRDQDGDIWVIGRIDDVLNVSGHRIGTAEVENALVSHPLVAEAAVVGRPDDVKGQAIIAFVTLKQHLNAASSTQEMLAQHVAETIGSLAKPAEIRLTEALPKTRSGKIMRRLLRELAIAGRIQGDTTTLEDFSVLQKLTQEHEDV